MRREGKKEEHFALAKRAPLQQGRTEVRVEGELRGGRRRERGGVKGREGTGLPPVHPLISPAVVSGRSTAISVEVKRFRPAINMEKHRILITSSF